jgi:hypothetical protein
MSTFKNPVGPQSSKVYWRRRLIVGLGLIAVIVIIILIVTRPGSAPDKKTTATQTQSQSSSASTPAKTPKDGDACAPANIKLEAITDKASYAAGQNPLISMRITNTGTAACTINLGSTQQELKITSGSETYWDSKDCQTDAVDSTQVLKPATPLTTPAITWDRTRSSKTTCSSSRPQVTAGGASYHLTVKVGDITSKETAQFLLN